ncbi:MAG: GIY-YIG nuclease family protein [Patescibacteria group bacterium]|jgi:putative endonuclease
MKEKHYYVYIITNRFNTVLYIGVTGDIYRRMAEHRQGTGEGFSKKYHLNKLIYLEETTDVWAALEREKQLKNWHRKWKMDLIRTLNPSLKDLSPNMLDEDAGSSPA